MRIAAVIVLLLLHSSTFARGRRSNEGLAAASRALDKALVQKDTMALHKILMPSVRYGHSNGWVEQKAEVIADLYNGKLVYNQISPLVPAVCSVDGRTGVVKVDVAVDIIYGSQPMQLKLRVLQVWTYEKRRWRLQGRQSTRI
jgi:hypothetical protein